MNALSFSFEDSPITVLVKGEAPWFIASQVAKAIHLTNPSVAIRALRNCERSKVTIDGRETNIISESGMYTLILRSQDAIKEGTPAFRFRVKVTDEILPAIRKTGRYEAPKPEYITVEHRWAIQKAVSQKARGQSVHYQTVYRALKDHFKVEKYTHILEADFDAAMAFINGLPRMEIPAQDPAPKQIPAPVPAPTFGPEMLEPLRDFVYCWRYLFRDDLELFYDFLCQVKSPRAPRFWEAVHTFNLGQLESRLAKAGYAVQDLDCYKHWAAAHRRARAA